MISYSGFRLRDTVSRVFPGALFSIFLLYEYSQQIASNPQVGKFETILLIAIFSYPIGIIAELLALFTEQSVLKHSKTLSEFAIIRKHLNCTPRELWTHYMFIYSSGKSEMLAVLEQYNLLRFFFLNIAFLSVVAIIFHSVHSYVLHDQFNFILALLIIVSYRFHIVLNDSYYMLLGIAKKLLIDERTNPPIAG